MSYDASPQFNNGGDPIFSRIDFRGRTLTAGSLAVGFNGFAVSLVNCQEFIPGDRRLGRDFKFDIRAFIFTV